jgi:hypothetical protein
MTDHSAPHAGSAEARPPAEAADSTAEARPPAEAAESTAADRRLYLEGGLRPLACQTCGMEVLVKKLSPQHTSIQWTTGSEGCPEIAARSAAGEHPARVDTCGRLRDSIERAAREGLLEVTRAEAD